MRIFPFINRLFIKIFLLLRLDFLLFLGGTDHELLGVLKLVLHSLVFTRPRLQEVSECIEYFLLLFHIFLPMQKVATQRGVKVNEFLCFNFELLLETLFHNQDRLNVFSDSVQGVLNLPLVVLQPFEVLKQPVLGVAVDPHQ